MQQFTSFHRLSVVTPQGIVAIGQNVPEVTFKGELRQSTATEMLKHIVGNLDRGVVILDLKMEELPLEGDYLVRSPTDFFTDEGIAFALASIFNWKDPRNGAPIEYKAGEGLHVRAPIDILKLDDAFKPFDPVNDLELCMVILQRFKVELRYEDRTGNAYFRGRHGEGNTFVTDEQIRREICRSAIDMRGGVISDCPWDGHIHLSMVLRPPATIADMATVEPTVVSGPETLQAVEAVVNAGG